MLYMYCATVHCIDHAAAREIGALERTLVEMFETCVTTCKYIFKEIHKQRYIRAIMCELR